MAPRYPWKGKAEQTQAMHQPQQQRRKIDPRICYFPRTGPLVVCIVSDSNYILGFNKRKARTLVVSSECENTMLTWNLEAHSVNSAKIRVCWNRRSQVQTVVWIKHNKFSLNVVCNIRYPGISSPFLESNAVSNVLVNFVKGKSRCIRNMGSAVITWVVVDKCGTNDRFFLESPFSNFINELSIKNGRILKVFIRKNRVAATNPNGASIV